MNRAWGSNWSPPWGASAAQAMAEDLPMFVGFARGGVWSTMPTPVGFQPATITDPAPPLPPSYGVQGLGASEAGEAGEPSLFRQSDPRSVYGFTHELAPTRSRRGFGSGWTALGSGSGLGALWVPLGIAGLASGAALWALREIRQTFEAWNEGRIGDQDLENRRLDLRETVVESAGSGQMTGDEARILIDLLEGRAPEQESGLVGWAKEHSGMIIASAAATVLGAVILRAVLK